MYGLSSFYVHFFFVYTIYGVIVSHFTKNKRNLTILLVFPLFLLSAMRGDTVGGDLEHYLPNFDLLKYTRNFHEIFEISSHEPGYVIFTKFIYLISPSHRCFFFFTSLLSLIGPSILIYKYSKNPLYSFLLYYSLGFYTNTFNNIRQSLAISICFISLIYLLKKDSKKFFALTILAATFHYSAISFTLLYPLTLRRISIKYFIAFIGFIVGVYLVVRVTVLSYFLNILAFKYDAEMVLQDSKSTGWNLLIFYIIIMVFELFIYLKYSNCLQKKDEQLLRVFLVMQMLAVACQLYSPLFASMVRLTYYFYIPIICTLPKIISLVPKYKEPVIFLSVLFSLYFMINMVFEYSAFVGSNSQGVIPYVLFDNVIY